MIYYKCFGIEYDEVAKDYKLLLTASVVLQERFSSLSYVYNFIDSLMMEEGPLTGEGFGNFTQHFTLNPEYA